MKTKVCRMKSIMKHVEGKYAAVRRKTSLLTHIIYQEAYNIQDIQENSLEKARYKTVIWSFENDWPLVRSITLLCSQQMFWFQNRFFIAPFAIQNWFLNVCAMKLHHDMCTCQLNRGWCRTLWMRSVLFNPHSWEYRMHSSIWLAFRVYNFCRCQQQANVNYIILICDSSIQLF